MKEIQQTENYSLFKRIRGNRTINKAQVAKLYDSFNENPDLASAVPIIVNDRMEIVDGQHRFEALSKLGLPISYIVREGLGLHEVQVVNSATKIWTPLDYAKSYAELGKDAYQTYIEFKNKYKLCHNILLSYLSGLDDMKGHTNTIKTFRQGRLAIPNVEFSHKLCRGLIDLQKYYNRGDSRSFAFAFKQAFQNPKYNHKRMVEKFSKHVKLIKDSPYAEDYMRQLERVYNYRCGFNERVKLY